MTRAKPGTQTGAADPTVLLVAPEQLETTQLERAAAIASSLDAELEVFCPIVSPPVPHSGMTQSIGPEAVDQGLAREEGRRLAAATLAAFNQRDIEAHVETGSCASMTEGILKAAERVRPDFMILPSSERASLLEQPFAIRFEELWDRLDVPIWHLQPGQTGFGNVVALLAAGGRRRDADNDHVAHEAVRLAERAGTAAHLVVCSRQPLAVATSRESVPPKGMTSIPQRRERRIVRELYEIAERYGIPEVHVHLYHGSERDVLEQMLEPLDIGLVVVSGQPSRALGGLMKRYRASELVELNCNLLVLGDTDETHA